MPKSLKPGSTFTVQVGGVSYPGIVDEDGVHRFVQNDVIRLLTIDGGPVNLNDLYVQVRRSKVPLRHVAEFWMMLGYSLSGFGELSMFEHLEMDCPTWWREGKTYEGETGPRTKREKQAKGGK